VTIVNKVGLHARPAAKLVRLTAKYKANVSLTYGENTINAKSIMGVMMLAVEQGGILKLTVEGEDEKELMAALIDLIKSGFGEE